MSKHKNSFGTIFSWVLAIVIIVSFVGGGAVMYLNRSGSSNAIASVNGEEILYSRNSDLYRIYQYYLQYYSYRFPDMSPELQYQVLQMALNEVIDSTITLQFAKKYKIEVSEIQILNEIKNNNAYYNAKGEFTFNERPESERLSIYKYTEENLMTQILDKDIEFGSILVSDLESYKFFKLSNDSFKGRMVVFDITDIDESELLRFYEASKDKYLEMEAAHILVKDEDTANSLYQSIMANPDSFETFAKEYSEDPGSKDKGGYLGTFDKTTMVKEFTDAAFALTKPGEISKPVKSDYGYHIIKAIKPPYPAPFDQVKDKVKKEFIQISRASLLENAKKRANDFFNQYRSSGNFDEVAQSMNVSVLDTNYFTFRGNVSDNYSARINDNFYNIVLKLKLGQITEPLTIEDGYIVFVLDDIKLYSKSDYEANKKEEDKKFSDLMKFFYNNDFFAFLKEMSKIRRYNIFNNDSSNSQGNNG